MAWSTDTDALRCSTVREGEEEEDTETILNGTERVMRRLDPRGESEVGREEGSAAEGERAVDEAASAVRCLLKEGQGEVCEGGHERPGRSLSE